MGALQRGMCEEWLNATNPLYADPRPMLQRSQLFVWKFVCFQDEPLEVKCSIQGHGSPETFGGQRQARSG